MLKELTTTEIKAYFESLVNDEQVLGNKIKMAQIYGAAKQQFDLLEEENPIKDKFNDYGNHVEEIIKIKDGCFIVNVKNNKTEGIFGNYWAIIINGKNISEVYPDREMALLGLVCYLKTNRTEAVYYMNKLLG